MTGGPIEREMLRAQMAEDAKKAAIEREKQAVADKAAAKKHFGASNLRYILDTLKGIRERYSPIHESAVGLNRYGFMTLDPDEEDADYTLEPKKHGVLGEGGVKPVSEDAYMLGLSWAFEPNSVNLLLDRGSGASRGFFRHAAIIEMTPGGLLVFHGKDKLKTTGWKNNFAIQEFGLGHMIDNPLRLTVKPLDYTASVGVEK